MCIPKQIIHPVDERKLLSPHCQSPQPYHTSTISSPSTLLAIATHHNPHQLDATRFEPLPLSIHQNLTTPFPTPPSTTLGTLHPLPLELIHLILPHLPIASLLSLRQTNRLSRSAVTSLPLYRLVTTHAPTALLAVCRFDLASKITLSALYSVLTTDKCHVCGGFGLYVFMPTLQRCCTRCVQDSNYGADYGAAGDRFDVLEITGKQQKGLVKFEREGCWIVRVAMGSCGLGKGVKFKEWTRVGGRGDSLSTITTEVESDEECRGEGVVTVGKKGAEKGKRSWLVAKRGVPEGYDLKGGEEFVPRGLREEVYERRMELRKRSMKSLCCVEMPPLEVHGGEVLAQKGVSCRGCKAELMRENGRALMAGHMPHCGSAEKGMADRQYSRRGFLEHFVWCHGAQELWEQSDGGKIRVKDDSD